VPSSATLSFVYRIDLVGMEIGQRVKVYRLRDRVSRPIAKRLGQVGTVQAFKMTDSSGVGVVVKFEDNFSTWFFEDELKVVQ
jgi:hypothetical protein